MALESSSIFKPYQNYESCRGERQIMLKTSIGRQLPYFVNFKRNTCQIFDIQWEKISHSYTFPESFRLIDADYFPTEEGRLGILLAIEDFRYAWGADHFILALTAPSNTPRLQITHSARVPHKITALKTLFSLTDMVQSGQNLKLYSKLMEWPHVVAVGCERTNCYLLKMSRVTSTSSESIPIADPSPSSLLNLTKSFTSEVEGVFRYTQEDGTYRDYPSEDVHVSALSLMPRSRTLLVGFSMGGILAASMNPSNQMTLLDLRQERLIRRIAPLEPEDDPDKFEYFIAAVDRSPRHPIMIQLWRGSFKSLAPIVENEKYDRPFFNVCLEHKIPFAEKWISVNPIVSERSETHFGRGNKSNLDSMLNVSQAFGATKNRNSVLLTYQKRVPNGDFHVEGAIFDMDAWYYKRVPGRVTTDGTVLRQSPFLSCIKSDLPAENVHDIGILTLDSSDVSRFSSLVSDADQLFYPSSLTFERVFVAESTVLRWMKIQNIQDTLLEKCASKLPFLIRNPDMVAAELIASGIVRKGALSPNSTIQEEKVENQWITLSAEQKILLHAMFYYGKADELNSLASEGQIDEELKREIGEWAVQEAIDYKRGISDKTVSVFEGSQLALSPLAEDAVIQGIKLFRVIHEYLKTCSRHVAKKFSGRFRNLASSVKCLKDHTKMVNQFLRFCIVPVDWKVQEKMREEHEKRKMIAARNRTSLPVQISVRTMHRLSEGSQFWNDDTPHTEWFPPTPVDLLETILNVNIPERIKREVVVQYIIDWLRVTNSKFFVNNFTDKELAIEVIKVMTNEMFEVDLEKIYYLLDQERAALSDQPVKSSWNDDVESVEDDGGFCYEKLWNGQVGLLGKEDLRRFEQRMKMQMEKGKSGVLPFLDPDSEKLYQVFLFGKEKYHLMSQEAIESNKLLKLFLPGIINKNKRKSISPVKTPKQKEIEKSVREMFRKNEQILEENERKTGEKSDNVYAVLAEKYSRKGRMEEEESTWTSGSYVPPVTPHRLQMGNRFASVISSSSGDSDEAPPTSPSQDLQQNADLNAKIATPSRYYKRPQKPSDGLSVDTDLLSPTAPQAPPLQAAQSILKTSKAHQSPGRGRIRFHESTRKGQEASEEQEDSEVPKTLDFGILDDKDEEELSTSRRELGLAEAEDVEKSFEGQESEASSDSDDVEVASESPVTPEVVEEPEEVEESSPEPDDGVIRTSEVQEDSDEEEEDVQKTSETSDDVEEALEAPEAPEDVQPAPEVPETSNPIPIASEDVQKAPEAPEVQKTLEPVQPTPEDVKQQSFERQESSEDEPLASNTIKRSRGRPPKAKTIRANSEEPTSSTPRPLEHSRWSRGSEAPTSSETPKKRGRPLKKRPSESLEDVAEETSEDVQIARKRGRPPKTPKSLEDVQEDSDEDSDDVKVAETPRKRGRPPKTPKNIVDAPESTEDVGPYPEVSSSTNSKKRGRPRKEDSAKRGPGRPKKTKTDDGEDSGEDSDDSDYSEGKNGMA